MKEFDTKIASLENEQRTHELQMETLAAIFRDATSLFLVSFYESYAKGEVKRKADVTTTLGKEKLSILKQKLSDLQNNVRAIIDEFLMLDNLWWHKSRGEKMYGYYGNRPPEVLDKAVRLAAGRLAPLLEEFGYLPTKLSDNGVWREWDRSGNHHPSNARPYYPQSLDWSPDMKRIVAEYDKARTNCEHITRRILQLQKEKRENQAEDLWESA